MVQSDRFKYKRDVCGFNSYSRETYICKLLLFSAQVDNVGRSAALYLLYTPSTMLSRCRIGREKLRTWIKEFRFSFLSNS